MTEIWCAIRLAAAILHAFPDVEPARAAQAAAAIVVEDGQHDPLLLAAIFIGESRLDPSAVNARTGACGIGQVLYSRDRAVQARRCRAIVGDARRGVRASVAKLDGARAWCARRGTPTTLCELATYASGPRGPRDGLYRQPNAVLARRDWLRRALGGRPGHISPLGSGS